MSALYVLPAEVVYERFCKVRKVFGNKADAWMRLVRIAAAGDEGVSHRDLFPTTNGWGTITKYRAAGLVETIRLPQPNKKGGRPSCRIVITRKGLDLLRMEATVRKGGA